MIGTMRKNVCAQIELVHLDRSRIDVTGSFAYDLTRQVSNFHTVWDSDWRRRRKLRRKTRLEKKGGNASNMELWCNFPFPPTLCRVIYLSAHQPNLICVVRNSRTALTLERKTKKKKKKRKNKFYRSARLSIFLIQRECPSPLNSSKHFSRVIRHFSHRETS